MLSDTQFILSIKSHKILYNNSRTLNRSDEVKKKKLWEAIAQNFNLKSPNEARQKWEQIIQNYIKFLRNGDKEALPYANEMQFMQPYILGDNSQDSSHSDLEIDDEELQRILYSDEEGDESGSPVEEKERKNKVVKVKEEHTTESVDSNALTHTSVDVGSTQLTSTVSSQAVTHTSSLNNLSSLELIFLGYAKVLQKMPLALQLQTKRKIAEIMDDAEMKSLQQ